MKPVGVGISAQLWGRFIPKTSREVVPKHCIYTRGPWLLYWRPGNKGINQVNQHYQKTSDCYLRIFSGQETARLQNNPLI